MIAKGNAYRAHFGGGNAGPHRPDRGRRGRQAECQDVMTIGRDAGNDIAPDDPRLPRRQPMPYRPRQDRDFSLADEGGSSGSVLNAARVSNSRPGSMTATGSRSARPRCCSACRPRPGAQTRRATARPTTLAVEPGVELLRIDILVADIRGFTPLTESTPVRRLAEGIDRWFRENSRRIRSRDGIVGRFLGDRVRAAGDQPRPDRPLLRVLGTACKLHRTTRRARRHHCEAAAANAHRCRHQHRQRRHRYRPGSYRKRRCRQPHLAPSGADQATRLTELAQSRGPSLTCRRPCGSCGNSASVLPAGPDR
ncbi:MAG: hypothetical protein MZV65_34305 [Chromatiales bacterium]|nr:hypothetical protein [Chromatiales bacterium]